MAKSRSGKESFTKAKLTGYVAAFCLIVGLMFLLGVLVGREWARSRPPTAREPERKPSSVARNEPREARREDRTAPIKEKLTFYQTLPAPLNSPPREGAKKPPSTQKSAPEKAPAKPQPVTKPVEPEIVKASVEEPSPPPGSQFWTVQVSAYRSRGLAEELQKSLRSAGYDAYLAQVASEDGKSRYRVRVGGYSTRIEAEKTAERLRTERALSPFVTPKNP
jgi:DedD protein